MLPGNGHAFVPYEVTAWWNGLQSIVEGGGGLGSTEQDLLAKFRWANRPATEGEVEDAQSVLELQLPSEYLTVMRKHGGGEGWVEDGEYLKLWPVSELVANNRSLEAKRLVPGVVLIGTNGAGELFAYQSESGTYWGYPAVGLRADTGKVLGNSWQDFLRALSVMA